MDHFSIAAGEVGILDCVARLSSAMSRFKDDYKLADADLDITRAARATFEAGNKRIRVKERFTSSPASQVS